MYLIVNLNRYLVRQYQQALGYKPQNNLGESCKEICDKVICIGDCTGIGNIIGATTDAYEAVWNL